MCISNDGVAALAAIYTEYRPSPVLYRVKHLSDCSGMLNGSKSTPT